MKRKTKNIITILLISVLLVCMYFTVTNNVSNNQSSVQNNQMGGMIGQGEPPEKPDDSSNDNAENQNNVPEKPNENSESSKSGTDSNVPDKPSNDNSNMAGGNNVMPGVGNAPEMNDNQNNSSVYYYIVLGLEGLITSSLIIYLLMSGFNKKSIKETFKSEDKIIIYLLSLSLLTLALTYSSDKLLSNNSTNKDNQMNNNMESENVTYKGAEEITKDTTISSGEYESTNSYENAILVSGDITSSLSNITVTKKGDSTSADGSSFYGNNSAILAKSGATLTLDNINVTTSSNGANGVFSYGGSATTNNSNSDGTNVTISNSKITTTGDNAGGIMTTGGGKTTANNLTINTSGTSSAAIRSDRGGETVTVNKGTYTTAGTGSPSIYSTADITVNNVTLVSKASEGIVIEGKNKVTINNTKLTDSNTKLNGQSTTYKNIFLYQSMSGDASTGTAEFTSKNSDIVTNNGDTFYVTNTTATINLTNNKITNNDSKGNFLRVQKDSWGNSGSNGGDVTLNMTNQEADGDIVIDSISTLTMNLKEKSSFTGKINSENSAKSIKLVLDKTSKIKLTGDSYISSLEDEDSSYDNIDFNGYKLYVNGTAIN